MLITRLQRIHYSKHLGGISPGRCGIGHDQSDSLLRVDDEDGADGESDSLLVHIRRVLMIDPASGPPKLPLAIFHRDSQVKKKTHLDRTQLTYHKDMPPSSLYPR